VKTGLEVEGRLRRLPRVAGRSADTPEVLQQRPTAGLALATGPPSLTLERTPPTTVRPHPAGATAYFATHELEIVADAITFAVLVGSVFSAARAYDIGLLITAAPRAARERRALRAGGGILR
jgi:hypothetical protein